MRLFRADGEKGDQPQKHITGAMTRARPVSASPSEARNSSFSASVSCANSASMAAEIMTERAPRAAAYSATRRLSALPEAALPSSTLAM
jgi:hypothetical protein